MVQIPFVLIQEHDSEDIEAPRGNGAFISLSDLGSWSPLAWDLRPGKKLSLKWSLGDQLILPSVLMQASVLSLPTFPNPQNEFLKAVFWCIFQNRPEIVFLFSVIFLLWHYTLTLYGASFYYKVNKESHQNVPQS